MPGCTGIVPECDDSSQNNHIRHLTEEGCHTIGHGLGLLPAGKIESHHIKGFRDMNKGVYVSDLL